MYILTDEWFLQDSSFEKMGELMSLNGGRLLGLYDEFSSFLARLNLFKGKGLSNSHEMNQFLELYNRNAWARSTSMLL